MIAKNEIEQQMRYLPHAPNEEFRELFNRMDGYGMANRYNYYGHITVSAIIIHLETDRVLLLQNRNDGLWTLPGGHINSRIDSINRALLYMIWETTKIDKECLVPVNVIDDIQRCVEINSHILPGNPGCGETSHYHHELRFVFGIKGWKERVEMNSHLYSDYDWTTFESNKVKEVLCFDNPIRLEDLLFSTISRYAEEDRRRGLSISVPLGKYQYNRGVAHMKTGNYIAAMKMFRKSIESYKHTYDECYETPVAIYNPAIQLAYCYVLTNNRRTAIKAFLEALNVSEMFRRFDYEDYYWYLELGVYTEVGRLYAELGEEEMAWYYYEKAVEYLRNSQARNKGCKGLK